MPFSDKEVEIARTSLSVKKLYKYRSFSDDKQKSRVKDVLLNHRIRFSRPSELNDPIEGKPIFSLGDWNSSEYKKKYEEWAWNTQKHIVNTPQKDQFIKWIRSLSKEQHQEKISEIVADNQVVIENKWRVLSLSAVSNQDLMWSHYSDSHNGLAIVFDASIGEFALSLKMEYVQKRIPLDIITQSDSNILFSTLLTKRISWAYEKEYRCISSEPYEEPFFPLKNQFLDFSPNQLLGVIFGVNMPLKDKELILSWAKSRSMPLLFWQAKIETSGDIVIDSY